MPRKKLQSSDQTFKEPLSSITEEENENSIDSGIKSDKSNSPTETTPTPPKRTGKSFVQEILNANPSISDSNLELRVRLAALKKSRSNESYR